MFRKAEMVYVDGGGVKLINVELDRDIIKDILGRHDNVGAKQRYLWTLKDAHEKVLRKMNNLVGEHTDDEMISIIEYELNKELDEELKNARRQIIKRKRKKQILDPIIDKIDNLLDTIDDDSDIEVNIDTSKSEYIPEPVEEKIEEELEELIDIEPDKIDFVFEIDENEVKKDG